MNTLVGCILGEVPRENAVKLRVGSSHSRSRAREDATMSKAVVDPEELRRFAADLKHFNTTVQEQVGVIQRRFSRLGETWRDQEQEKFAESFERMIVTMNRFIEASDQHIPVLMRKAQKIQEYLG
jgi:uncharacterized protein YukE